VPESTAFEIEITIGKVIKHKSRGTDRIPTALIKAGG
jgi:hypothetical protein